MARRSRNLSHHSATSEEWGEREAIQALAQHWPEHPETLAIIQQLLTTDKGAVRNALKLDQENISKEELKKFLSKKSIPGGHFSTLRTKITDGELLKTALSELGITVKCEADVQVFSQRVRADIVAVLDGEYDIGWSRNDDGSFALIADLWGVAKRYSQTDLINSINQKYAVLKTLKEVKQRSTYLGLAE